LSAVVRENAWVLEAIGWLLGATGAGALATGIVLAFRTKGAKNSFTGEELREARRRGTIRSAEWRPILLILGGLVLLLGSSAVWVLRYSPEFAAGFLVVFTVASVWFVWANRRARKRKKS
jgi:Flp pilus assembly protein TadB